jgi:anti-sigma factor ChrR (cupin superfamily)
MTATPVSTRPSTTHTIAPAHPLASRYIDVEAMPWHPSQFKGIDIKVLYQDKATGLLTALFRWAPGAELPLHEHTRIEQTFVLEGSFEDEEGVCTAGNYVWRPAGSRHVARSKNGAILIGFFLKPNDFLGPDGERTVFDTGQS